MRALSHWHLQQRAGRVCMLSVSSRHVQPEPGLVHLQLLRARHLRQHIRSLALLDVPRSCHLPAAMHHHSQLRLHRRARLRHARLPTRLLRSQRYIRVRESACRLIRTVRRLQLQHLSQRPRPLPPSHVFTFHWCRQQHYMQCVSPWKLLPIFRHASPPVVRDRHLLPRRCRHVPRSLRSLSTRHIFRVSWLCILHQLLRRHVLSFQRNAAVPLPHQLVPALHRLQPLQ